MPYNIIVEIGTTSNNDINSNTNEYINNTLNKHIHSNTNEEINSTLNTHTEPTTITNKIVGTKLDINIDSTTMVHYHESQHYQPVTVKLYQTHTQVQ